MDSLALISGRLIFLFSIFIVYPAYSVELIRGGCVSQDEIGDCELIELKPSEGHITNICTEVGGSFGDFGTCTIHPARADGAIEEARRRATETVILPPPPAPSNTLLPLVQKCETAAQTTTSTCARSATHLSHARQEIDSLNDLLSGHGGSSPAAACTYMRDSVSAARSLLTAWQTSCGGAMTNCQSSCDSIQAAVASQPTLSARVAQALNSCRGLTSQRDEVQRSVAMASSAVAGSSLCRQQLGANDEKRKQDDLAKANPFVPTASQIPTTQVPSTLSAPNFPTAHTSLPTHYQPESPMNQRPIGLPETHERDTQGSVAGPGRITADNSIPESETSTRKAIQPATPPTPGAAVRFDVGKNQAPPKAARPQVASSAARETPRMGFYPAAQAPTPAAAKPAVRNGRSAVAPPTARNLRAALPGLNSARKRSLLHSQLRSPSNTSPRFRAAGAHREIADRSTNLFGNIRKHFARLAAGL